MRCARCSHRFIYSWKKTISFHSCTHSSSHHPVAEDAPHLCATTQPPRWASCIGVVTPNNTIDTTFNIIKIHHLSTSLFSLFLTSVQFFALHSHRLRRNMHDAHKCTCIRELIAPVSAIQFAVCCGCTLDRRRRRKRRNRRRKIIVSCSMGIVKKVGNVHEFFSSFPVGHPAAVIQRWQCCLRRPDCECQSSYSR